MRTSPRLCLANPIWLRAAAFGPGGVGLHRRCDKHRLLRPPCQDRIRSPSGRRRICQTKPSRSAAVGAAALAAALLVLVAAGCGPVRSGAARGGAGGGAVLGPTEVLEAHNAWADSIEQIWSRVNVTLNVPREEGSAERRRYDVDGHLFLAKPDGLFLHGQVLGQEMFALGMNAQEYWLWIRPEVNRVWRGRRSGPGEARLIVSPTDLAAALGVFRIEPAADGYAEFTAQARHYVLAEDRVAGGKRVPLRRVWFDRATLRPVRIDLFDEAGSRVLLAELLRYRPVGTTDLCTVYRARFTRGQEVDLVIQLSAVRLDKKPNPRVFEYRTPPGATERDLDEAVKEETPQVAPAEGEAPSPAGGAE